MLPSTAPSGCQVVRPPRHPSLLPAQRESQGKERTEGPSSSATEVPRGMCALPAWVRQRRGKQVPRGPFSGAFLPSGPDAVSQAGLAPQKRRSRA